MFTNCNFYLEGGKCSHKDASNPYHSLCLGQEKCGAWDESVTNKALNPDALTDLYEGLKDALKEICQMCIRLNPQHKDCTSCEEMERSRLPLDKAEGK